MTPPTHFIDVSSSQAPASIDWKKVKASGAFGAIVRTGYGLKADASASAHAANVLAAGLELGTYHYVIPREGEAKAQAEAMVAAWRASNATIVPAADLEASEKESPIVAGGDSELLADWLDAFFARAEQLLQKQPIVYTGAGWFGRLPRERAWDHRTRALWVASYRRPTPTIPFPWDEHALWQHSANTIWSDNSFGPTPKTPGAKKIADPGKIDGFAGEIDCNALGNDTIACLRAGRQPRSKLDFSNVRDRQRALRRLGIDPGPLDGDWGNRSTTALIEAQKMLGVDVTGVWDTTTRAAIEKSLR